ncbi:MAG: (Fe-S)-binding protein, partial [Actinomycetota bacterium]
RASLGYQTLGDFTWKELLDFDACTKCGRCHEVCPARASGAPLSPRDLILDLRQFAEQATRVRPFLDWERRAADEGTPGGGDGNGDGAGTAPSGAKLAGGIIPAETLWACTTCMACVEACPVGIEHVPTIIQLRRSLVDEGDLEPTLQDALQNIAQQGNSFGQSARTRGKWAKELPFPVKDARKKPVRVLWFVGDYMSFDPRLQGLARSLATILDDAGVDFGILYDGERNAGNDVRRVGEEGLFEMLVEQNIKTLSTCDFNEIITSDPHTYNTLKNEYPQFGGSWKITHYTEFLLRLLERGLITPKRGMGIRATYHDPCYLARYNRVIDAPRDILGRLGVELVEMPRNRENTFCCGAGGGRIWMDDSTLAERPSEQRMKEASELGITHFVVACPKDVTMYRDAAKTTGFDDRITVVDIVELIEHVTREPETAGAVG